VRPISLLLGVGAIALVVVLYRVSRPEPYMPDPNSLAMQYHLAKETADAMFERAKQDGNWEPVIAAYKYALSLKPDSAEAHNDVGAAHYNKGMFLLAPPVEENLRDYSPNPRDVVDYIRTRLDSVPAGKFAWSVPESVLEPLEAYVRTRGDVLYHSRREEWGFYEVVFITGATREAFIQAELEFRRALDLKPDYGPPYRNLSALYVMRGRTEDAIALLKEFVKREPQDRDAAHYLQQLERL
jgi:tetratricopeptide (TPR) repeat protein